VLRRWLKTPVRQGIAGALLLVVAVGVYFAVRAVASPGPSPAQKPRPTSVATRPIKLAEGAQFTPQPGWTVSNENSDHTNILLEHSNPNGIFSISVTQGTTDNPETALQQDMPQMLGADYTGIRNIKVFATNHGFFDEGATAGFTFLTASGQAASVNGEAVELVSTLTGKRALVVFIPPSLAALKALTHSVAEMTFSLAPG
jgi:hypothetical protein